MLEESRECTAVFFFHGGDRADVQLRLSTWQETKNQPEERKGDVICLYTNVKMSRHVILSRGDEVFG